MKRIISVVLFVVVLFMLSSCGIKNEQSNDTKQNNNPKNVSNMIEQKAEQKQIKENETEQQTEQQGQVQISVDGEALNPELPTDLTFLKYYEKVFSNDFLVFSSTHWFYNDSKDMSHYHKDNDGSLIAPLSINSTN